MLPKVLLIALEELQRGVAELPGAPSHDRIKLYLASVGQPGNDEIPWCSAFVNWCVEVAGLVGTKNATARSWLKWGQEILTPQFGAIAIFKRGTQAWQGHVTFLLYANETWAYVVGGNQSDRVSVARYPIADLIGLRIPV